MKGREEVTMDGETRITWALRPSYDTHRVRAQRVTAGISEQTERLRARVVSATVELASASSHPRLAKTQHVPTAP